MKILFWFLVALFFANVIVWIIYFAKDAKGEDCIEKILTSTITLNVINIIQVLEVFIKIGG